MSRTRLPPRNLSRAFMTERICDSNVPVAQFAVLHSVVALCCHGEDLDGKHVSLSLEISELRKIVRESVWIELCIGPASRLSRDQLLGFLPWV